MKGDFSRMTWDPAKRYTRVLMQQGRVLLDSDLAGPYGVTTKRLNEQVRRNVAKFPPDFILELSNQELAILRSQIATLRFGHGQHSKVPHARLHGARRHHGCDDSQ